MRACSVVGCDNPSEKTGLCSTHYQRKRKGQPLVPTRRLLRAGETRTCLFEGCGRSGTKRGMCPGHYQQAAAGQVLRPLRTRDIDRPCAGPCCSRPAVCKGLCDGHYQQQRAGKELAPLHQVYVVCSLPGCGRANRREGLCDLHYMRSISKGPWVAPRRPSPIRVEPGDTFARVGLFQGGEPVVDALVDLADIPLVSPYRWYVSKGGYAVTRIQGHTRNMHRLVMSAPRDLEVDHIDGVRHNNRRDNLRLVDKKLQAENKRVRSDSGTGLRGVHFDKKKGLYRVFSTKNGVRRGHRHKRLEDAVAEAEALRAQYMTHHNEERSRRD